MKKVLLPSACELVANEIVFKITAVQFPHAKILDAVLLGFF